MPPVEDLPFGSALGTVLLHSCDVITEEDLSEISDEELAFGFYDSGRYACDMTPAFSSK
jgi:activating signal cointegrator 1